MLRLLWRSRRNKAYRFRIAERFGFSSLSLEKSIWVHAVSVGESMVAIALIKKLQQLYPQHSIVVTTMTPTGSARIQAALGDSVSHVYIPYDLPTALARFIKKAKPLVAILVETELWPNLFAACRKHAIPMVIANGRLSPHSFRGYQRISALTREMLGSLALLMAQGKNDAERFIALGADPKRVVMTGNIKFDLEVPADLIARSEVLRMHLGQERPVWIAASTHPGEEEIVLKAHRQILNKVPEALLVLVPRHPERFKPVAELIQEQGFQVVRRSLGENCEPKTSVYLGDTMGEMFLLYAVSDVSFVAGSFAQIGGHNLLEPAALAKPVISGPVLYNFKEIAEMLQQASALTLVKDASTLAEAVLDFFANQAYRHEQGQAALAVVEANRGALAKHLDLTSAIILK